MVYLHINSFPECLESNFPRATSSERIPRRVLRNQCTHRLPARALILLLRLALLLPELRNLQFHVLVHPLLQFRAVAEEEQNLHPDKQRRQQQGLHEVIEQCRGPPFERPVPDELRQPRHHVNTPGVVVHDHAVSAEEIVAGGCGADHQRRDQTTRDGFEEHIKDGVDERTDRAGIGREVVDVQGIRNGEEWWAVACLDATRQL